jgi:hypothetical protein
MDITDPIMFNDKIPKIGFFGVTTGSTKPLQNERLKICNWSLSNRDISDFYITRVAQIEEDIVRSAYPRFEEMTHPYASQESQYKHKFLLSADGNTCSYDRMCWIMKSNSMLFKYYSNDYLWYYPLINEGTHFANVTVDNMRSKFNYYLNNPNETEFIIKSANNLFKNLITPMNTMLYTTFLFETFAENNA